MFTGIFVRTIKYENGQYYIRFDNCSSEKKIIKVSIFNVNEGIIIDVKLATISFRRNITKFCFDSKKDRYIYLTINKQHKKIVYHNQSE